MAACDSDLTMVGVVEGEEAITVIRIVTTLISLTVTSAWFGGRKIKRLSLFFAHWLAGLVAGLGHLVEDAMVTLCWTTSNLEGFMKALKFIELSAFNMFAVTNLAICVNLALVVSSHRTMTRVRSVSSPPLLLVFLAISMGLAAPIVPLADEVFVSGAGFLVRNDRQRGNDFIQISFFYVEFFVGVCMLLIVAWLLLFRVKEVKECWKLHARIRFYSLLTLVGTAANLCIGICGTVNLLNDGYNVLLIIWSWIFRYIHVALDTIVLYGVLRQRSIDERGEDNGTASGSGGSNLPSGRRVSRHSSMLRRSRGSSSSSKPIPATPLV